MENPSPNSQVAQLQNWLIKQGYNTGINGAPVKADGNFTANTYAALLKASESAKDATTKEALKQLVTAIGDVQIDPSEAKLMQNLDTLPVTSGLDDGEEVVNTPAATSQSSRLAPQDAGTMKLQEWLKQIGMNTGFDNKPLEVDGRFGPNTYYACRRFLAVGPNDELREKFATLLNDTHRTMWVDPEVIEKINTALPIKQGQAARVAPKSQRELDHIYQQQKLDTEYNKQKAAGLTGSSAPSSAQKPPAPAKKTFSPSGSFGVYGESLERIIALSRI
jgi:peptidoglycan hydrolase-like protein with peptidoglycan-binding domain